MRTMTFPDDHRRSTTTKTALTIAKRDVSPRQRNAVRVIHLNTVGELELYPGEISPPSTTITRRCRPWHTCDCVHREVDCCRSPDRIARVDPWTKTRTVIDNTGRAYAPPTALYDDRTKEHARLPQVILVSDAARQEGGAAFGSRAKHRLPAGPHSYTIAGIVRLTTAPPPRQDERVSCVGTRHSTPQARP
jgi:hypothetical protein